MKCCSRRKYPRRFGKVACVFVQASTLRVEQRRLEHSIDGTWPSTGTHEFTRYRLAPCVRRSPRAACQRRRWCSIYLVASSGRATRQLLARALPLYRPLPPVNRPVSLFMFTKATPTIHHSANANVACTIRSRPPTSSSSQHVL